MGVGSITRQAAKTSIMLGEQSLQDGVGLLARLRFCQTEFFHPAILGRAERSLDAALGLRAMGLDQLDVQFPQGPAELGFALVIGLAFLVRLEDAVPIRVERHRPAILLQPPLQEIEMCLHVVGWVEAGQHA
jgi:hypothetical protein